MRGTNPLTSPVDIRPDHLEIVQDILIKNLPAGVKVWVFGSRANWTTKDSSDLDLVLEGEGKLSHSVLGALKDAFEDSSLPYTVDVVDFNRIGDAFKQIVELQRTPLPTISRSLDMGDEWRQLSFSQAVHINPRVRLQREESYPFVDMASVSPENRSVQPKGIRAYKGGGSRFIAGDTLMARITPCLENGKIARYAPDQTDIAIQAHGSTEFYVIRGRDKVSDNDFAYYLARSEEVRNYAISQMSGTSGRQRVPKDCFDHLIIALPSLPEQRAIARILGTLDDKIELNRRMNETLEAIARALFKSWFVDFDPVRAKMAGRDTGLPPHVAALFPDRLVDSELGEIPEGWNTYSLEDLARHHSKTLAPSSSPESEFEHYSIPAFDSGFSPAIELGSAIKSNKTIIPDNAVLLSKLNPEILRVWIPAQSDSLNQICSTEFLVFSPDGPGQRSLLFSLFTEESFRSLLQSMVTGTSKSHQRVPVWALKKCVVLSGTCELFSLFDRLVSPNLRSVLENRASSRTLADMRDTLLPKLISGELRVRDADSFLERAL